MIDFETIKPTELIIDGDGVKISGFIGSEEDGRSIFFDDGFGVVLNLGPFSTFSDFIELKNIL